MEFETAAKNPADPPSVCMRTGSPGRLALALGLALVLTACATPQPSVADPKAHLPLLRGWFDGEEVLYITTDVSDPGEARAKGSNYAPRLVHALPRGAGTQAARAGEPSATDKVYAVTNHAQSSVFASAPWPVGHANTFSSYSPLWQMVTVTWLPGHAPRTLKSEEDVLAAVEPGAVRLQPTSIILNCPIVHRGSKGGLPGVSVDLTESLPR